MPQRLLVVYRGANAPLVWQRVDERGRPLTEPTRTDSVPEAGAASIWAVVPGEAVLLLDSDLRARDRAQLERALPYAVEDQLAEPVEAVHVAAAPHPGGRAHLVLVVRRTTLEGWLTDLLRRGVRADALVPDTALLPVASTTQVLFDGERALIRIGAAQAAVAPKPDLASWLRLAGADRAADVYAVDDPELGAHARWHRITDATGWLLDRLAAIDGTQAPNLLTGPYAPQHRDASLRRSWKTAAGLAAGAVAIAFTGALAEYWLLRERVAGIEAEMAALYREVWPDSPLHPDPAGRMRSELGPGNSERGDALALLATAAPVLGGSSSVSIRAIEYRSGELDVHLTAQSVAALDAVREGAAATPGLSAELASASTGEQGAEGRLKIRAGGAR